MNNEKNKYFMFPRRLLIKLDNLRIIHLTDKQKLKLLFVTRMNKKLDLSNPKTYNEKLQWLKLNDRNSKYTQMVDKVEAKKIVAQIIGEKYIIPTLGVYDKFDDVNFDELPNKFVIKCTHDSGGNFIVKDKNAFDKKMAKKKIDKCLKRNYYINNREWPYKDIKPRIIIEKLMENENGKNDIPDYKFFCFNGKCKLMFIATDRQEKTETCFDFFDENFNHLQFTNGHPNAKVTPQKPSKFNEMVLLSEKIAKSIGSPQVRIDFYEVNNEVYFGEITFYHWSGMVPFTPEKWDYTFGTYINLKENNN